MAVLDKNSSEYIDINLYEDSVPLITDPLHLFLQEIELGMKILPGQIWGITDSINLKKYIFNRYITMNQVKNEITSFISSNCTHSAMFNYTVDLQVINVEQKELIYIIVTIYVEDELTKEIKQFMQKFVLG